MLLSWLGTKVRCLSNCSKPERLQLQRKFILSAVKSASGFNDFALEGSLAEGASSDEEFYYLTDFVILGTVLLSCLGVVKSPTL